MPARAERQGLRVTECKTCGRKVFFVVDEKGKRQILDASAPVFLVGNTDAGARAQRTMGGYVSHFATCPQASLHSK